MRQETFKFWDLVWLIIEVWWQLLFRCCKGQSCHHLNPASRKCCSAPESRCCHVSRCLSLMKLMLWMSSGRQWNQVNWINTNSLLPCLQQINVCKLTIIGSDNGLLAGRHQAIIWTNPGILLIGPLGTNFSEILIEIQTSSLEKISLKMSSAKCCPFRLGLNVLTEATVNWQAGRCQSVSLGPIS